jgi:predicted dehydrogenase
MACLTAAVVGTGFIGPVHVEALRRAGVQVAGILGSNPSKSNTAAEALQLPHGYPSFQDILNDKTVDAVHITTPNRFHFEQAQAVLKAGKHVLCEKPLAMTSCESASLVEQARTSGLAAGVAYNIRFYPLCHEAAERVRSGNIGKLFHVIGSYTQDWLLYPTDYNWRVSSTEGGKLRAIADIGTHWLDLVQFVVGEKVTSVCADLSTLHKQRFRNKGSSETFSQARPTQATHDAVPIDTEDCGCVMLRFANGAQGVLWVSQCTAGKKNALHFELSGSEQSLTWDSQRPNELQIGRRTGPNENLIRDPALLSASAAQITNYPGGHNEGFPDSFKQLFRTFYGSIQSGEYRNNPRYPTFADGHYEILLCEAILRSNQSKSWVSLGNP